jgi:protein tyrosine phosphatase (PTP) superfamily phosphohydrolase (DUF442 family)
VPALHVPPHHRRGLHKLICGHRQAAEAAESLVTVAELVCFAASRDVRSQPMHRLFLSRARFLSLLALVAAFAAPGNALSQTLRLAAPNVVEISPMLSTSGQPSAEALGGLKAQGFQTVIYLAPPTVSDAVREEQLIVTRQGLTFINIPIQFDNPTESDFEAFASVLSALRDRKVLVHCQVNLRASSMVFLYRTITLKEQPLAAYQAVQRVWSPSGPWRRLIESQLRKHSISFELD